MTDKRINKLKRKLQEARYRLLTREPELAAPLVEMLQASQMLYSLVVAISSYPVRASLTPAVL